MLKLFADALDLHDLAETDTQREQKVLSRCLAAYAVYREVGCTPAEAAASVWDGTGDNGIDAVYVDTADQRIVIVQAKWINNGAGEPEAKDLRTFASGVKDLVEQENGEFSDRLSSKLAVAQEAMLEVGTTIRMVIVTTGKSEYATPATNVMEKLVAVLNNDDTDDSASWSAMGLDDIMRGLSDDGSAGKITVDATLYDWSYFGSPHAAYFGIIDGLQLKQWWSSNGNRLVARNIRHALGSTDVNDAISHTAKSEPEKFWYFNNGITLVADEAKRAPALAGARSAGNFTFSGASIVNGAQTVSTLGRVAEDDKLGLVRIPIRIVLLKDAPQGFGSEVTRTNNLQNRVEARDFAAQDPEQLRLQREMQIEDVDYQYLRGEVSPSSATRTDLIEVTTALACASGDPTLAVLAKTAIGRFFSDLNRPPYKTIFNSSVPGARAFNAVSAQRVIETWVEEKKRSIGQKKGIPWGVLVHGNRVLEAGIFRLLGREKLDLPISEFRDQLSTIPLAGYAELVYEAMLLVLERDHEGRFMAVLFKGPTKSKDVLEEALGIIQALADASPASQDGG